MTAITTTAQVLATTGVTVTDEQIATASGVIEAVTGLDLTLDPLPLVKRDVRHLRAAVAWQARFMLDPEAGAAIDRAGNLTSASANGVAVAWGGDGSADAILAPLARLALKRLSWKGSKTVRMVPGRTYEAGLTERQTTTLDGSDQAWTPLR